MGKKANKDEVNFNYPIPRALHNKVKILNINTGIPVKSIVINALVMYTDYMNKMLDDDMIDKALNEPQGTDGFEDDDL